MIYIYKNLDDTPLWVYQESCMPTLLILNVKAPKNSLESLKQNEAESFRYISNLNHLTLKHKIALRLLVSSS